MSRVAKSAETSAGSGQRADAACRDDIESEFLGIWLGLARLREKVRLLTARETAVPAPRRPA